MKSHSVIYLLAILEIGLSLNIHILTEKPESISLSQGKHELTVKDAFGIHFEQQPLTKEVQYSLRIDVKNHLIGIQYCQKFDKQQKITNAEFNDPKFISFLNVRQMPDEWKQIIGEQNLANLEKIGSLLAVDTLKCKEYFIHEYRDELDVYRGDFLGKTKFTFRNDIDLREISQNLENWSLVINFDGTQQQASLILSQKVSEKILRPKNLQQLFINGQQFESQIKRINPPVQYKVQRRIQGEGLHQRLYTTLEFQELPKDKECSVAIADYLDIYSYVDKDELDKEKEKYVLNTIVDIERPITNSQQHIYYSLHKLDQKQNTLSYNHQYHFRYQPPGQNEYEKGYIPKYPSVFIDCQDSQNDRDLAFKDVQQLTVEDKFQRKFRKALLYQTKTEALFVLVPVGLIDHKQPVFVITIGVTLGMALYIARVITKETKHFS